MSIKIYNGLSGGNDDEVDPFLLAGEIRCTLQKVFYDKAEALLDDPNVEEESAFELSRAIDNLHHSSMWTFDRLDIGYDVAIMQGQTKLLVLVFGENATRYTQLLVDSGVCAEFGYWDNAGQEEGVTDGEWRLREREWGYALRSSDGVNFSASPSEVGLMIAHPNQTMLHMEMLKRKKEGQ